MKTVNKIHNEVEQFLKDKGVLSQNSVFVVGFSGGVDSLCLLDTLKQLQPKYKFKIVAAHLNHNWRGEESKNEEIKSKDFCKHSDIKFYSESLPESLPHTELEARNQRYDFFNRTAKKYSATAILTGHTSTDQAETVLYRIIKGTGINGLQGIPEMRPQQNGPVILRPIIDISRQETTEYCNEQNIEPVIDSSNAEQRFLRNKIRLSLLPELKSYNSSIENAIIRLSEIAAESQEIVDEHISQKKEEIYKNDEIETEKFKNCSKSVQKLILIDLLSKHQIQYDYKKIDELLNFIYESSNLKSGNTCSLTSDLWIFASKSIIKVITEITSSMLKSSVRLKLEGQTDIEQINTTICVKPCSQRPSTFPDRYSKTAYVNLDEIQDDIQVRTRQPGDIFQPFGLEKPIKLKKYLINEGIPEFKRDSLLMLAVKNEIIWIVGVGLSAKLKVKNTPSHLIEVK